MSRLLENILIKNKSINFNFSKSIRENTDNIIQRNIDNYLPVDVDHGSWSTSIVNNIEALVKNYNFSNFDHMFYFISEALKEFNIKEIIPKINIKGKNVRVILYTEEINMVTEVDIEMSKYLDEINEDIIYIEGST